MYSVKPIGINIKDNDRDVPDGSLQESINMQWRDGSFKPIPERIVSEINASGYKKIIFHKVGDENQINVLGFNQGTVVPSYLAFNLGRYLGGTISGSNKLEWFGTILNGVYTPKTAIEIQIEITAGMSYTILNGLIYFMGDGSSATEQYYYKLEFNETTQAYNVFDMYAWKGLVPFYPFQGDITLSALKKTYNVLAAIGTVLVRFALVLKSGEIVLPTPIYSFNIYSLTTSDTIIAEGSAYKNIHSVINLNLAFLDSSLMADEISAINVYASIPSYQSELDFEASVTYIITDRNYQESSVIAEQAEKQFYLVKTLDNVTDQKLVLYVGGFDWGIDFDFGSDFLKADMNSIAAGELMPVDNFTYHKIFGKIGSYNGRLDVLRPTTILSGGHTRALAVADGDSIQGYSILTEDGSREKILSSMDKYVGIGATVGSFYTRGILSYPDYRAFSVGLHELTELKIYFFKSRKNTSHNLSCAFGFVVDDNYSNADMIEDPLNALKLKVTINYDCFFNYTDTLDDTTSDLSFNVAKYSSDNRIQFAEIGEFKVWPAINSYRIGEGKVMNMGTGSVNPSDSFVISPIIVGTTDGIYTINLDPTGNNFISSITKTASLPFLSEEILEIDNNILFVSDQGLMVFSNGDFKNLTKDYFPQQGNGGFPLQESVFNGYNLLTQDFFGEYGNPYVFDDIVRYLKGAILAFDARRNNVWCSNSDYNFSLVYNLDSKQWGMSTLIFNEKQELFSIIATSEGEIYSRYMIRSTTNDNLLILSGEDLSQEVFYHIMTRPIKFERIDEFKELSRMFSRTLLVRVTVNGYFSLGLWGQQDITRYKKSLPIALKNDNSINVFPNDIRYQIPINCRKGKYKAITVLQSGKVLPESYISSFDFDINPIDNNKMR